MSIELMLSEEKLNAKELAPHKGLWLYNATIQLQAAFLKARERAPWVLPFKELDCDGYLKRRA